jgi:histidinol phosphatase-like enzyme
MKKIFFDSDEVIIKNHRYLINHNKIKWLKGSIKAMCYILHTYKI